MEGEIKSFIILLVNPYTEMSSLLISFSEQEEEEEEKEEWPVK